MKIYKAINAVQLALSKIGISKDQKNTQQNFKFRGIDDVMNTLSPLLAEHGICMLPHVINRTVNERISKTGGTLFYVTLEVEYSLVCAEDNSSHIIAVYGEAMDSGDKATNKALSAAYKYAALQTFCIPIEGSDPDATTHEVVAEKPKVEPPKQPIQSNIPKLSQNLNLLKGAIKRYQISEQQVMEWKQKYSVATLADLSDREALEILDIIHLMNKMKSENKG